MPRDFANESEVEARGYVPSGLPAQAIPDDPVLRTLIEARRWLSDPRRWTQGVAARNFDGEECNPEGVGVVTTCAIGAIVHLAGTGRAIAFVSPLGRQVPASFKIDPTSKIAIAQFNDAPTTTHADILQLFDRAIEARRQEISR